MYFIKYVIGLNENTVGANWQDTEDERKFSIFFISQSFIHLRLMRREEKCRKVGNYLHSISKSHRESTGACDGAGNYGILFFLCVYLISPFLSFLFTCFLWFDFLWQSLLIWIVLLFIVLVFVFHFLYICSVNHPSQMWFTLLTPLSREQRQENKWSFLTESHLHVNPCKGPMILYYT